MNASTVQCPHCFEFVELTLDPFGGERQEYVEDCEVCCRPWRVQVIFEGPESPNVSIERV